MRVAGLGNDAPADDAFVRYRDELRAVEMDVFLDPGLKFFDRRCCRHGEIAPLPGNRVIGAMDVGYMSGLEWLDEKHEYSYISLKAMLSGRSCGYVASI